MKSITLLAIALIVCMSACKKHDPLSPQLFGKWEVRRVYGGNIYPPDSTYKVGNGNIMQFNTDSTFAHYVQGQVVAKGAFHTRNNAFKNGQTNYDEIYFDNDTSFKSLIVLNGESLTIKPLIPDISTTDYQKLQ